MVSTEGSNHSGFVGKDDLVVGVGREEALEEGDGRVEDDGAFDTGLDANLDLGVVDEVGADALNVRGGLAVEVSRADHRPEAVGLDLCGHAHKNRFRTMFLEKNMENKPRQEQWSRC